MSRRARLILPGVALRLIRRWNNRSACFVSDENYLFYLKRLAHQGRPAWLRDTRLVTNHVHLLLTPATPTTAGMMMKGLGQRYVQYINRTYGRLAPCGRAASAPV